MPKRIVIKPYLKVAELRGRYRNAPDLVTRCHWQIIWLLAQGKTTELVSDVTGYSVNWVRKIADRYNQAGPDGLGDGRRHNQGGAPLLDRQSQLELQELLQTPAPGGRGWTNQLVAEWIETRTGRSVYPQLASAYRHRLIKEACYPSPHNT